MKSAQEWLNAAEKTIDTSPNPAAFNALHAIELAAKACLRHETDEEFTTHQIGGSFGKHFKGEVSRDKLRKLSRFMSHYSRVRYPNAKRIDLEEAADVLDFAKEFIQEVAPSILKQ